MRLECTLRAHILHMNIIHGSCAVTYTVEGYSFHVYYHFTKWSINWQSHRYNLVPESFNNMHFVYRHPTTLITTLLIILIRADPRCLFSRFPQASRCAAFMCPLTPSNRNTTIHTHSGTVINIHVISIRTLYPSVQVCMETTSLQRDTFKLRSKGNHTSQFYQMFDLKHVS